MIIGWFDRRLPISFIGWPSILRRTPAQRQGTVRQCFWSVAWGQWIGFVVEEVWKVNSHGRSNAWKGLKTPSFGANTSTGRNNWADSYWSQRWKGVLRRMHLADTKSQSFWLVTQLDNRVILNGFVCLFFFFRSLFMNAILMEKVSKGIRIAWPFIARHEPIPGVLVWIVWRFSYFSLQ